MVSLFRYNSQRRGLALRKMLFYTERIYHWYLQYKSRSSEWMQSRTFWRIKVGIDRSRIRKQVHFGSKLMIYLNPHTVYFPSGHRKSISDNLIELLRVFTGKYAVEFCYSVRGETETRVEHVSHMIWVFSFQRHHLIEAQMPYDARMDCKRKTKV